MLSSSDWQHLERRLTSCRKSILEDQRRYSPQGQGIFLIPWQTGLLIICLYSYNQLYCYLVFLPTTTHIYSVWKAITFDQCTCAQCVQLNSPLNPIAIGILRPNMTKTLSVLNVIAVTGTQPGCTISTYTSRSDRKQ